MTLQPVALVFSFTALVGSQSSDTPPPVTQPVHVSNTSDFEIGAPMARVAPLFGPEAERCWAGKHWNPEFLYPRPARDVEGAVFQIQHGQHTSVWVNTLFDLSGGRIQYVAFIDGIVVTTLDIKLTSTGKSTTDVEVTATRTALQADADDDVQALGESDRNSGSDTRTSIDRCLGIEPR